MKEERLSSSHSPIFSVHPDDLGLAIRNFLDDPRPEGFSLCVGEDGTILEGEFAPGPNPDEGHPSAASCLGPRLAEECLPVLLSAARQGISISRDIAIPFENDTRQLTLRSYPLPGRRSMLLTVHDTTPLLELAQERDATVEMLRAMRLPSELHDLMREMVRLIRHLTGCEAVGIRLEDGEDFPYFETAGFSEDFILKETQLCSKDGNGEIRRDASGRPVLECMCGNIIRNRTDASLPFFTEHGSFWTNSTTRLLASTSSEERQAETRNRCNGVGYESVALFPLRTAGETFGLLQVNDRRPNRFSPQSLQLLERLADNLAIGLQQRRTDQRLQNSLREKEVLLREIHHRVKNNLQSLCSLLRLQKRKIENPQALDILQSYQLRIQAIADVHELLYQSDSLSRLDLKEYLAKLTGFLQVLHEDQSSQVQILAHFDAVEAGIDETISIGLILCELITNAYRHAFPPPRKGNIRLDLRLETDGSATLEVADDGIGLPPGTEKGSGPAFGLELVSLLARQLHGRLTFEGREGTSFRLHIPDIGRKTGPTS